MLLAIDGSTRNTGYAFGGVNDVSPRGGSWELPGADDMVLDRTLATIYGSIHDLARLIKAEHVVIEQFIAPSFESNFHSIAALIQLTGAMRAAATRAGCKVHMIGSSTVRKHFIGRGNLKSKEAKEAVQARCDLLHWTYKDNDQADAIACWSWGMSTYYREWSPRSTPLFGRAV